VTGFPATRSPREKVVLIDQLLHGSTGITSMAIRDPVAVNLIEGKLADVIAFLDRLKPMGRRVRQARTRHSPSGWKRVRTFANGP